MKFYAVCSSHECDFYKGSQDGDLLDFCATCGSEMVKYCSVSNCGAPITSPNSHYCEKCGKPLKPVE